MASNVFGIPITTETLKSLPEYVGKEITRKDRANLALRWKHDNNKDINARTYVENLKAQWGTGVSTKCLIYNATGDNVRYVTNHDWYGHIGPSPYPIAIANGQWGAFLHVKKTAAASGSVGALVYRGLNESDVNCDWMLSWSNPWNTTRYSNQVYTEIRDGGHFTAARWIDIYRLLEKSGTYDEDKWKGCFSQVTTGLGTTAVFEATMTQFDARLKKSMTQ